MSTTKPRTKIGRITVAVGAIGALWFAVAAPFFQGWTLHR